MTAPILDAVVKVGGGLARPAGVDTAAGSAVDSIEPLSGAPARVSAAGVPGGREEARPLRRFLDELAEAARHHPLLVVPGGGSFADAVRVEAARFRSSDEAAHWMAILAMEQYGLLLADLLPEAEVVKDLDAAAAVWARGWIPVLAPYGLLRRHDPLPHGWEVTSDSLAAWVASLAGARRLILVKPGGVEAGVGTIDPFLRACLADGSAGALAPRGGRLPEVWAISGGEPGLLGRLLAGEAGSGVRLG